MKVPTGLLTPRTAFQSPRRLSETIAALRSGLRIVRLNSDVVRLEAAVFFVWPFLNCCSFPAGLAFSISLSSSSGPSFVPAEVFSFALFEGFPGLGPRGQAPVKRPSLPRPFFRHTRADEGSCICPGRAHVFCLCFTLSSPQ